MRSVGLFEAKAKLSELCERVARDEQPIVITRRGKPLVRLEPAAERREATSVWSAREAFLEVEGWPSEELDLPPRKVDRRRRALG
ncbi:MAG: type II toxin-antitoxin system Phd/YefM family antitoxin [Deltaproteobacteria bacterium]|nr:type II toxin-antitoxin system Phd/YefM family antitoxin [Deltaproteobacteria bacterium]